MNDSSFDNQLNKILLKPRFVFEHQEPKDAILKKFKETFELTSSKFQGKVVGNHIVIDVTKKDEHFWSPQLQIEIEKNEDNTSMIKGLFGPKPQLWTLFMFIHFGVALAFAVFATMLYTRFSLDQDYTFPLVMTITMPVLWILFYLFGRLGKKKGYGQMTELYTFVKAVLSN